MDKKPVVKQKSLFERIAVPVVIAVGIPAVIFIKLLEPSFVSYKSYSREADQLALKGGLLKKQLSAAEGTNTGKQKEKPVIYLLNYLEKLTEKSDIKLKSFQDTASAGVNGISSFQMRFACNVITYGKFLYLCENTLPPLAINNWRISSLAGGSYSGLRQVEGTATVSFLTAGAGAKAVFADPEKFKADWRDIFSETPSNVKAPPPVEEEAEPDPVLKYSLTAQMSDRDSDIIIITDSLNRRVTVDLKKNGGRSAVKEDNVEVTLGVEKFIWKLGDSLEQEKIPAGIVKVMTAAKEEAAAAVVAAAAVAASRMEQKEAPAIVPAADNPPDRTSRRSRRNRDAAE